MIQQILFECNYCSSKQCKFYEESNKNTFEGKPCTYEGYHSGVWICKNTDAQKEYMEKL